MSDNEAGVSSRRVHVTTYMWRGVKYAPTSAFAILAGYFVQSHGIATNDLLLLSILLLASIYFFICYANRFHPTDSHIVPSGIVGTTLQSEAVWMYPVFVILPYSFFVPLLVSKSEALSYKLLFAFVVFILLSIFYGWFVLNYKTANTLALVRHQLIWPVVLTIAIGFYYGLIFSVAKTSFLPLIPVALVVTLFIISHVFKFSGAVFAVVTIAAYVGTTIVSVINQIGYLGFLTNLNLSFFLLCISASAYLAVFEAWKITADLAIGESVHTNPLDLAEVDHNQTGKSSEYATATLAALTASVGLMPFYFVFSSYGGYFLILFSAHAVFALLFWYYRGLPPYLRTWPWAGIKVGVGAMFIALLVAAPTQLFSRQFTLPFLRGLSGWGGLGLLAVIVVILVQSTVRDLDRIRKDGVKRVELELFKHRVNFIRLLSLLCILFCLIISGLLQAIDEKSALHVRAELAFQMYALCIFLCGLIAAIEYSRQTPMLNSTVSSIVGFLLLVRIFTSLMISLVVILPSIQLGFGVSNAVARAMPFFLAAAGGFALNDCHDLVNDAVNKPYRAIPSGRLSRRSAFLISQILLWASVLVAWSQSNTIFEALIYAASIIGVVTYNLFVKHLTVSKTFLTSIISSLPLLYVVSVLDYPRSYLLLPFASGLFLLGREFLMDIRDVTGDSLAGIRTVAAIFGDNWTALAAFFCLASGAGISLILALQLSSKWSIYLSGITLLSTALLGCLWFVSPKRYRRPLVLSLWIPMSSGILMLIR